MVKQYGLVHAKRKSNGKKGKPVKTAAQLNAQAGKFSFTEINGFKLKEVEWTVPDKKTRKRRRSGFDSVRKEFLKHIGATMEPALRDLGLTDKQIEQVKKGHAPVGYNVHHKLPIHGGGLNEFSNLILMPIKPHDELHHKVMDPQVAQMQTGDSKKVLIPWTDDMVYADPERKKAQPQKSVLIAKAAAARTGR